MKSRKAFTLMEIILVVIIIGMLAALVMPRMTGIVEKTRVKSAMSQIATIKLALTRFEAGCGRYPTDAEGLEALIVQPAGWPEYAEWEKFLDSEKIPLDPWGQGYVYRLSGTDATEYELFSKGRDQKEGTDDDIDITK